MATTDGISTEDWNRVTELTMKIWKHLNDADEETCRRDLFDYLDALESKYGSLPSILATRADFLTSSNEVSTKEELLTRAYALALQRRDQTNALAIAHSLADLYLGELQKPVEGGRWLNCFRTQLYADTDDAWWSEEYERFKALAKDLEPESE